MNTATQPLDPEFDAIDPMEASRTWMIHYWSDRDRTCQCIACRFSRERIYRNPEPPPESEKPFAGPGCPDCGPEAEVSTFTIDHVPGYGAGPTVTRCEECGLDLLTE